MEYRRKKHIAYKPRHGGALPAYIAVFGLFFGIVYLISASAAGTWVAENWVAPIFMDKSIKAQATEDSPAPENTPGETAASPQGTWETAVVTLPAYTCYGLQIGVYENADHAAAQSEALQKIGAAGYVCRDGERYRVLAAGYPDEASLEKVSAQLLTEGIESRAYRITSPERKITVTAEAGDVQAVKSAAESMQLLLSHFYQRVIQLDKGETTLPSASALLCQEAESAQTLLQAAVSRTEGNGELKAMDAYFETALETLGGLPESADKAQASAFFKHAYLELTMAYCAYAQSETTEN